MLRDLPQFVPQLRDGVHPCHVVELVGVSHGQVDRQLLAHLGGDAAVGAAQGVKVAAQALLADALVRLPFVTLGIELVGVQPPDQTAELHRDLVLVPLDVRSAEAGQEQQVGVLRAGGLGALLQVLPDGPARLRPQPRQAVGPRLAAGVVDPLALQGAAGDREGELGQVGVAEAGVQAQQDHRRHRGTGALALGRHLLGQPAHAGLAPRPLGPELVLVQGAAVELLAEVVDVEQLGAVLLLVPLARPAAVAAGRERELVAVVGQGEPGGGLGQELEQAPHHGDELPLAVEAEPLAQGAVEAAEVVGGQGAVGRLADRPLGVGAVGAEELERLLVLVVRALLDPADGQADSLALAGEEQVGQARDGEVLGVGDGRSFRLGLRRPGGVPQVGEVGAVVLVRGLRGGRLADAADPLRLLVDALVPAGLDAVAVHGAEAELGGGEGHGGGWVRVMKRYASALCATALYAENAVKQVFSAVSLMGLQIRYSWVRIPPRPFLNSPGKIEEKTRIAPPGVRAGPTRLCRAKPCFQGENRGRRYAGRYAQPLALSFAPAAHPPHLWHKSLIREAVAAIGGGRC